MKNKHIKNRIPNTAHVLVKTAKRIYSISMWILKHVDSSH